MLFNDPQPQVKCARSVVADEMADRLFAERLESIKDGPSFIKAAELAAAEKPITLDLAREVLKDCIRQIKKPLHFQTIQECVADEFGVSLVELKTKRRNKNIVLPRQIAMYLSRRLTEASLPEIARFFGGKDHTTVLYAYNKIKSELENNTDLKHRVHKIIQNIKQ